MPETILVVDDDPDIARFVEVNLRSAGYDVSVASDGEEALEKAATLRPDLVLLDVMMPRIDGFEVAQRLRRNPQTSNTSIIMLTAKALSTDKVLGLTAGADDYIIKPFDVGVLRARVAIGARIAALQQNLGQRVEELQAALDMVKQLSGLLPICSYCKRIRRDDGDRWQQLESYLSDHSEAEFSHGVCPDCYERAKRDLGL
jgi:DNA-binding response OmpR family regulator